MEEVLWERLTAGWTGEGDEDDDDSRIREEMDGVCVVECGCCAAGTWCSTGRAWVECGDM